MTTAEISPPEDQEYARIGHGDTPPEIYLLDPPPSTEYLAAKSLRSVGHTEHFRYATRYHFELVTDDNEVRATTLTLPTPERQVTDTLTVRTGAWWTSGRGHNAHDDLHLAKAGLPNWYLAAPGESAPGRTLHSLARVALHPLRTIEQLRDIELDRTAAIMHASLDLLPYALQSFDIKTDSVAVMGESHGAMSGLHMIAQAPQHNRDVITAELIASCYLDPIDNLGAVKTIARQLPAEVRAIYELAKNVPPQTLRHLLGSVSLHPLAVASQLAMWPTLHSGKPRQAISQLATDQHMGITTFIGDKSGQPELIEEAFADFPNVTIRRRRGAHFSIALPHTLEESTQALVDKLAV